VDDTKLINSFKQNFSSTSSFLSSVVKGRINRRYRQYGRDNFETLLQVPGKLMSLVTILVYLGKNLEKEIDIEKVREHLVDDKQNHNALLYFLCYKSNPTRIYFR
jgi:hypothetical protein